VRTGILLALALVGALSAAAPASAQPQSGVARPPNEERLPLRELGEQLYAGNCSMCHGADARGQLRPRRSSEGIMGQGPSLRGVGAQSVDFYLRTGYMPLAEPGEQPERRRPLFNDHEIRALVDYVSSLPPPGPPVPHPDPAKGNFAEGYEVFTEHCAGCHQVVARGGVATGARVPPLEDSTPTQIAQAVRIGPYLMPKFSDKEITNAELDSLIRYAEMSAKHPYDEGGWGIGNIGPVPEGMVTWMLAAVAFVLMCLVIGSRLRRS
jgi:ubiquinol-cytochrome c reductase cytochrome c subunit